MAACESIFRRLLRRIDFANSGNRFMAASRVLGEESVKEAGK